MRKDLPFFEGVNNLVEHNLSKKQELEHAENARSIKIGSIEKRAGTLSTGSSLTATGNYGLYYFENDDNKGVYRISTVDGFTNPYYLNNSSTWTKVAISQPGLYELASSSTQYNITNPSGTTMTYTYNGSGTSPSHLVVAKVGDTIIINGQDFSSANNGTFTITALTSTYFSITNASGVIESNKAVGTGSIYVEKTPFSSTVAEGCCFFVNGSFDNFYVGNNTNGGTIATSADYFGHLYKSPKARKIKYFKDRLYLADYSIGSVRYKNSIMMSSPPLGLVSLVDGDYDASVSEITVTDTKYIHAAYGGNAGDYLDVYRGDVKITTIGVNTKSNNKLQVAATGAALQSSDELWIKDTYDGTRAFRWADSPSSGDNIKQYDTIKINGGNGDRIKMLETISDFLVIGSDNALSMWNGSSLQNIDLGVGCVSDNGYVKAFGSIWFIHYSGIYSTSGDIPKLISSKVERYFQGATKAGIEASCAGKKGLNIFFTLGNVTLYHPDGTVESTLSDVVLEYNIRQDNWFIHTGIKATQFLNYPDTDDVDKLLFSSTETNYRVMEFLTGKFDDHVSSQVEIPFRVDTSNITLSSSFEKFCYPMQVIIEAETGSGIKCFVSLDNGQFYSLDGEASSGCTILKIKNQIPHESGPPRCRKIRISLREFSKKKVKITRIALIYSLTLEEEEMDSDN